MKLETSHCWPYGPIFHVEKEMGNIARRATDLQNISNP